MLKNESVFEKYSAILTLKSTTKHLKFPNQESEVLRYLKWIFQKWNVGLIKLKGARDGNSIIRKRASLSTNGDLQYYMLKSFRTRNI